MASGRHRERPGGRPTATQSSVGKGIRTRIRSASYVDKLPSHATADARKQHRKRERPLHHLGAREAAVLRERLCPPPFTSTRHVTRERGLGGVAPKSGAPFCAARAGRAHAIRSFSSRLCSYQLPVFPVCERVFVFALVEMLTTSTFFDHVDTGHGISGFTLPWPNPSGAVTPRPCTLTRTARAHDTDCLPHRP